MQRFFLFIPLFLTACFGPTMFGINKEDFEQLSEKERVAVIEAYNERRKKQVEADIAMREKEQEHRERMAPIDAALNFIGLFTKPDALSISSSTHSSVRLSDGHGYRFSKHHSKEWHFGDQIEIYKSNDRLYPLFLYNVTRSEGRRAAQF